MRRILHVDMDAFFAAVEMLRHPELADRPLVVGGSGDPAARGVVSTANYAARRYGIHSAMPLRTAFQLCPDAVFLPVDYPEYARVSARIKAILRRHAAVMEDAGIDEAYLDLSDTDRPTEEIARELKRDIRQATGLTCSVGIAPNKLLAKIASDLQKPDGLSVVTAADLETRIWPLPVRAIPGVGPVTEMKLHRLGIVTIGELAAEPLDDLVAVFGTAHGNALHRAARGLDERPLVTHWEARSHSRETTFQHDTDDWQTIARTLAALARKVADDLRQGGLRGGKVGIKVRFADFETHTREKTLETATDSAEAIRKAAFACLGRLALKKKVRLVGLRVSDLGKAAA